MNFSFTLKALEFYKLKAEKPLRYLFLILFLTRLGLNIYQIPYVDIVPQLYGYLEQAGQLQSEDLLKIFGPEQITYFIAGFIGLLLQGVVIYIYACVLFYELQPTMANRVELQAEAIDKPKGLFAALAKIRAFVWLYRRRQELSQDIPRVLEQASILAQADGRNQISEADLRKAEQVLDQDKQASANQGPEWMGPGSSSTRSQSIPRDFLLQYKQDQVERPWALTFKNIFRALPQLILFACLMILAFVFSLPFLSLPFAVLITMYAYTPLNLIINQDRFGLALKRSAKVQKGFKMLLFSQLIIINLICSMPTYLLGSVFIDSPYSFAIIESLFYVIKTLALGRLLGMMFTVIGFDQGPFEGANYA